MEEQVSSRNIAKQLSISTQSLYEDFFSILITVEDIIKDNHKQSLIDKNNKYNNALAIIETKAIYKVFNFAYKNNFAPVLEQNDYIDTSIIFPETIIALKIKIFALLKLQQRLISPSSYLLLKKFSSISLQDDFACERNFIVSINLQNDSTILSRGYTEFDISLYKQDILQYHAGMYLNSPIVFKRAFNQTQSLKLLKSSSYELRDIMKIEYLSSIFFSSLPKMKKSFLETIDISQILIYEDPAIFVSTVLGNKSEFQLANIYNYNFSHALTQSPNITSSKDNLIHPINNKTIQHLFFNMTDNNSSNNYLISNVSSLPGFVGNYNDSDNDDVNPKNRTDNFSSLTKRDLFSFSAIFILVALYAREKKKNQNTIATQNEQVVSNSYLKGQVITLGKSTQRDESLEVKVEAGIQTDNLEIARDSIVTKLDTSEKAIQCDESPKGRSEIEIQTDDEQLRSEKDTVNSLKSQLNDQEIKYRTQLENLKRQDDSNQAEIENDRALISSQQNYINELNRKLANQEILIAEKGKLTNIIKVNKERSEKQLRKRAEIILDKQKFLLDLEDKSKRKKYLFSQIIEGQVDRIKEQDYIIFNLRLELDQIDSERTGLKKMLLELKDGFQREKGQKISLVTSMRDLNDRNKRLGAQVLQNKDEIKEYKDKLTSFDQERKGYLGEIDRMKDEREKIAHYLNRASKENLSDQKEMSLAEELKETMILEEKKIRSSKTSPRIESEEICFDELQIYHSPTKDKRYEFADLSEDDESSQYITNYDNEISVLNGSTQDETNILEKIGPWPIIEIMKDVIEKREEKIQELTREKRFIAKQLKKNDKRHNYEVKTQIKRATDKLTESLSLKSKENILIREELDRVTLISRNLEYRLRLTKDDSSKVIKDLRIELSKKNQIIKIAEVELRNFLEETEEIKRINDRTRIEHKREIDKWKQEVERVNSEYTGLQEYLNLLEEDLEKIAIESKGKDLINFEMRMEFDSYREEAERRIEYNQDYRKESEEKLESYSRIIMELTSRIKDLDDASISDYKEIRELASMLGYEKSSRYQESDLVYTYSSVTAAIEMGINKDGDSDYKDLEIDYGQFDIGSEADHRYASRNTKYELSETDRRYNSQSLIVANYSKSFFKDSIQFKTVDIANQYRTSSFTKISFQDSNTEEVIQGQIGTNSVRSYSSEASSMPISTSSQDYVIVNAKKTALKQLLNINSARYYSSEASSMSYVSTQRIDPAPFHDYHFDRSRLNKISLIETSSQDSASEYAHVNSIKAVLEQLGIMQSNHLIDIEANNQKSEDAYSEKNKNQEMPFGGLQNIQVNNAQFQIQVQTQEKAITIRSQVKKNPRYLMPTKASTAKLTQMGYEKDKVKAAPKNAIKGEDLDIFDEGHSIESLEVNLKTIPNVKLNVAVLPLHEAVTKAQSSDSLTLIDTLSATSKFALGIKSNCRAEDRIIFTGMQEDDSSCGDISLIIASGLQNTNLYKEIGIATVTNGYMNHAIVYVISDLRNQRLVFDAIQDEIRAYNKFSYPSHQLAIPISKSSYTDDVTKLSDFFAQQTTAHIFGTNIAGYFKSAIDILDMNIKKVIYRDDISKFNTIVKNYQGIETIELNVFKNPSAFRKLLFKIHPDKNQNSLSSTADFVFVQELKEKINIPISFVDITYSALSKTVFALNIINKSFNAIATLNNPSINNIVQSTKDFIDLICADINVPYCLLANSAASIAIKVYNNDINEAVTEAVTGIAMHNLLKSILPYGGAPVAMIALTYSLYSLSSNIYNKLYDSPNDYDSVVEASSNPEYFDSAAVTGITMQYAQPDVFVLY